MSEIKEKNSIGKVEVMNFPKKEIWDKLNIIVTIIALIIALVSLKLYFNEINKTPDLYLQVHSSYPFMFNESDFTEPTELILGVNNKGNDDSHSLFFTIVFSNKVNISFNPHSTTKTGNLNYLYYIDRWKEAKLAHSKNKLFTFSEPDFFIPKDGFEKSIGKFEISIPISNKNKDKIKIAMAYFDGDFKKTACIVYYNYNLKKYLVMNYNDMKEVTKIWNEE